MIPMRMTRALAAAFVAILLTPVGILSVFGFEAPVPYPFGAERTGYLVNNMDAAIRAARAADLIQRIEAAILPNIAFRFHYPVLECL